MKLSTPVRLLRKKELVIHVLDAGSKIESFLHCSQVLDKKEKYIGKEQLIQTFPVE
jgi:hypothetical protein